MIFYLIFQTLDVTTWNEKLYITDHHLRAVCWRIWWSVEILETGGITCWACGKAGMRTTVEEVLESWQLDRQQEVNQ
jgi:hypothetical protein